MSASDDSAKYTPQLHEKLAFFGTITASLSHELKNVLATINEFSGLLEDLVSASERGRPLDPQRLQSTCARIAKQVSRGEVLIGRLNRFAHSVDEPASRVDLDAQISSFAQLTNRFAKLKQVVLEYSPPETSISITLDPFALQQAMFLCLRMALDAATERRVVTLSLQQDDSTVLIAVQSADPLQQTSVSPAHLAQLSAVMQQLGGQVQWERDPDRIILSFLRK